MHKFKFTLSYLNGLSISYNTDTYQEFLHALVDADCVGKRVLKWLVSHKDIRQNNTYTYWNNGASVYLTKEKL